MPKYSYQSKHSKEPITTADFRNKTEAIEFFAKIKVLTKDKFLELYEVAER